MRLVSWNCNGALRRKHHLLDALDADVLVIQECEDPEQSIPEYRDWAGQYVWAGYGKNKGIGIFARHGQSIRRLDWAGHDYALFLPAQIGSSSPILGVWTQAATPASLGYIGQFWHYFQHNLNCFQPDLVIAGDFNSNAIWDRPRRVWNHSDCVRELRARGFSSLYHAARNEPHGAESVPTYFQNRFVDRPYHLDYIFAHQNRIGHGFVCMVGDREAWISASDHLPIIADLN